MRKKMVFFLFTLFASSTLFCQEPAYRVEKTKGYNPPSFLEIQNSWHLNSQCSFLYWQPKEVATDLGATKKNDLSHAGKTILMRGHFKPGMKVCMGATHLRDNWDVVGRYTHLTAREGKLFEAKQNEKLLPYWQHVITSSDDPSFSDAHWTLHLNIGDLELGRAYFANPKISLHPFVSLRALWLHQKYHVFYTYDEGLLFSHLNTRSYLLGPHFGVRTTFQLVNEFSLLANIEGTIGAQHFKNRMESNYFSSGDSLPFNIATNRWQVTPSFQSSLGFQWGSYFYHKKGHLSLSCLYEFLHFWNQNAMRQLKDTTSIVDGASFRGNPESGDLFFQGLTITFALDF
jgi:hypothetical protein